MPKYFIIAYLTLVLLVGCLAGYALSSVRQRQSIPAEWLSADHPKPCPRCNGQMDAYRVGCRWMMGCCDCGEMMPADEYQRWLERKGG